MDFPLKSRWGENEKGYDERSLVMCFEVPLSSRRSHPSFSISLTCSTAMLKWWADEFVAMATGVYANALIFLWAEFHLGIHLLDACPFFPCFSLSRLWCVRGCLRAQSFMLLFRTQNTPLHTIKAFMHNTFIILKPELARDYISSLHTLKCERVQFVSFRALLIA